MPSPIEQARTQGVGLRNLLITNKERLRDRKLLGLMQGGFRFCPIELFVAISDNGRITRKRGAERVAPEAMKADQIAARVRAMVQRHRRAGGLFGMLRSSMPSAPTSSDGDYTLTLEEMERLRVFLLERHVPRG